MPNISVFFHDACHVDEFLTRLSVPEKTHVLQCILSRASRVTICLTTSSVSSIVSTQLQSKKTGWKRSLQQVHWKSMPNFNGDSKFHVTLQYTSEQDISSIFPGQKLSSAVFFPDKRSHDGIEYIWQSSTTAAEPTVVPEFPIYIISKGRAETAGGGGFTHRELQHLKLFHYVVVEAQEHAEYAKYIPENQLLVLNDSYKRAYDTCDALGDTKSFGPGPARNFCWDHAISRGATWHWVMDDNIQRFARFNNCRRVKVSTPAYFKACEDFVQRYTNIAIAGPQYEMFIRPYGTSVYFPFTLNTRIYSCLLIRNNIPYRWRGRYNEDTDLCLRVLKDGLCTVLFNFFLQEKRRTQEVRGGNTAEFYSREGTTPKSEMLAQLHPDVAKTAFRFKRAHHIVNYAGFTQELQLRENEIEIDDSGDNEYDTHLVHRGRPLGKPKLGVRN